MIDHAKRLRDILARVASAGLDPDARLAILETADYIEDLIVGIRVLYFYGRDEALAELPEPVANIIGATEISWVRPEPGVPEP